MGLIILAASTQVVGQLTATGSAAFNYTDVPGAERSGGAQDVSATSGDFNCDGFADVAIGNPMAAINGALEAGQVMVLYGAASGLLATRSEVWSQSSPNVPGGSEEEDEFGTALAAGKLSNDACDELAIGAPGETLNNDPFVSVDAGAVTMLRGGSNGLTATGAVFLPEDLGAGGDDGVDKFDRFGSVLAIGSIVSQANSFEELVIGIPRDKRALSAPRAGSVEIRRATPTPLGAKVGRFDQNDAGELNAADDDFGTALAIGDFDNDGVADLAIGVPGESPDDVVSAGKINVLFGSSPPFTSGGAVSINQNTGNVPGVNEDDDRFGSALAAGDIDGDGDDDLIVGVHSEDVGDGFNEGMIMLLEGRNDGTNGFADATALTGVDVAVTAPNTPETDEFGRSLAIGDFNNDGFADIVAAAPSAPGTAAAGAARGGAVVVIYGGNSALGNLSRQIWTQDTPGIFGQSESSDFFGRALAAGDYNGDGNDDLVIVAPGEDIGSTLTGSIHVLYGSQPPLLIDGFE